MYLTFFIFGTDEADPIVLDEEEFALVRDLKSKKKEYQLVFHVGDIVFALPGSICAFLVQERKMAESELVYIKGLVAQTKAQLCSAFAAW